MRTIRFLAKQQANTCGLLENPQKKQKFLGKSRKTRIKHCPPRDIVKTNVFREIPGKKRLNKSAIYIVTNSYFEIQI